MAGEGEPSTETTLKVTPTWIVASVCSVIVLVSLTFERSLHYLGKALKDTRKPLFDALLKLKEELMLLGFISLLLTVSKDAIQKICISEALMEHMLPCNGEEAVYMTALYFGASASGDSAIRRLLKAEGSASGHCLSKGQVPLLSLESLEQIHLFIFVLAVTHVVLSAVTVLLGIVQMRNWKHWESTLETEDDSAPEMIKWVQHFKFIQDRFKGFGKGYNVTSWMLSFFKQFYGSVTKEDYTTMRVGFIMKHCRGNPSFNFYNYMIRALENDYKKVVGISWYFWICVMVFLLVNVSGWHSYFWISLIRLVLLLVLGMKLEHIVTLLAYEVAEKHTAVEGALVVNPSDELFWFRSPRMVLILIHFILFLNAFEIAYFFWILATFGLNSCIMDRLGFSISRIVICAIIQILCSYSTLPLYAIVSHMGSSFKSAIFADDVSRHIKDWAIGSRRLKGYQRAATVAGVVGTGAEPSGRGRQSRNVQDESTDLA